VDTPANHEEIAAILAELPEPTAVAFAIAGYAGLRVGEVEGLRWEDVRDHHINVSRSIWAGRENPPKTSAGLAPVPMIRQLSDRVEMYRLRCGNPASGWLFTTRKGTRENLNNMTA
jgi:integrase